MKTLRDLLLQRHRPATPQLDAIRRAVLAEHVGGPADDASAPLRVQIWNELFCRCRRAWLGFGAAWLLVLGLNLAGNRDASPAPTGSLEPPGQRADLRVMLAEKQRLRAELLDAPAPFSAERHAPPLSRPRSANALHLGRTIPRETVFPAHQA